MKIKGYMAASLDGFIADKDGGVRWLEAFPAPDAGYDNFIAGIGMVVFGRTTFDQTRGFSTKWPSVGKRSIVVTSRPLVEPPEDAESWGDGVALLIKALRNETGEAGRRLGDRRCKSCSRPSSPPALSTASTFL